MSWLRKPPPKTRCDAHTGSGHDSTGKPVVYQCQNLAVETAINRIGHETWLCEKCVASLEEQGEVRRNPKVKR